MTDDERAARSAAREIHIANRRRISSEYNSAMGSENERYYREICAIQERFEATTK